MQKLPKSLEPTTLAELSGIRLRARHIVDGYLAGLHRSPYHGRSIEFTQHREYTTGDDIRHIDWKVFGRTDRFFVKQYEDESNLICRILLDTSESMHFKADSSSLTKYEYGQCLTAAWSWLILRQSDAAGAMLFDTTIHSEIPAHAGSNHFDAILDLIEDPVINPQTDLTAVLCALNKKLTRRNVVVIISDCFGDISGLNDQLKMLCQHRHDVILLQIMDPVEVNLALRADVTLNGLEQTGSRFVPVRQLRKAYCAQVTQFRQALSEMSLKAGASFHAIDSDQPLNQVIQEILMQHAAHAVAKV